MIEARQTRESVPTMTLQQALEEAQRCLLCHDAPCSSGCPGGTDPGKFIRQMRFLNFKGAARTILRNNPLGGVCARICPSETTCRQGCVRAGLDRPIDIDGLQQFAVEYGRKLGVQPELPQAASHGRVAIIGAGPAGLTAASILAGQGYPVTLYDSRSEAGGMLRYGIPEQRLPLATLQEDLAQLRQSGIEWRMDSEVSADEASKLLERGFDAVFVAPGLWQARTLTIPGIESQGVWAAMAFLSTGRTAPERINECVTGQNVAIVGGGSVAMDVALTARELGAKRIYVLALEEQNQLPATQSELRSAWADSVEVRPHCRVVRVLQHEGRVVGLEGIETEWIQPGSLAPSNARDIPGTEFRLRVGVVIQAIGQTAMTNMRAVLGKASTPATVGSNDPDSQQPIPGLFAGGDLVRGAGTVVEAVGDGKRAAEAIHAYLAAKGVQK